MLARRFNGLHARHGSYTHFLTLALDSYDRASKKFAELALRLPSRLFGDKLHLPASPLLPSAADVPGITHVLVQVALFEYIMPAGVAFTPLTAVARPAEARGLKYLFIATGTANGGHLNPLRYGLYVKLPRDYI